MALILLRTKWNNEAFKGMVESPTNRRKATQEAFRTIGWELRDIYLCVASETWHILAEGDPSKMIQAEKYICSISRPMALNAERFISSRSFPLNLPVVKPLIPSAENRLRNIMVAISLFLVNLNALMR